MRRRSFLATLLAAGVPAASPIDIGPIVFTERRSYGLVLCGANATVLLDRSGIHIFSPGVNS